MKPTAPFRRLFLLFFLFATAFAARAQAPPVVGTPNFNTFQSLGFDSINRADMDIHFRIPIFSRAGRIPFTYGLNYDSAIWAAYDSYVENAGYINPAETLTGWNPVTPIGQMSAIVSPSGSCGYYNYEDDDYDDSITIYSELWTFSDPGGTPHFVTGGPGWTFMSDESDLGDTNCPAPSSAGYTYPLSDNSGYSLLVDDYGSASIFDPNGNSYYPGGMVDRNGNQLFISASGDETDYFDSLNSSTPALEVIQPSDTTIYYKYHGNDGSLVTITETLGPDTLTAPCTSSDWGALYIPSGLTLEDGSSYSFDYNANSQLDDVHLPTGGEIAYTHTFDCSNGADSDLKRWESVDGIGGANPLWEWTESSGVTTEVSPAGDHTVITFGAGGGGTMPTEIDTNSGSSTLLRKIIAAYTLSGSQVDARRLTTVLPAGGGSYVNTQHYEVYDALMHPTEVDDYDWYADASTAGTRLRKGLTTYAFRDGTYDTVSVPTTAKVYDSSDTQVAQTDFGYDATSVTATSGTANLLLPPWAARGNLTSVKSYSASGSYLEDDYTYFDTGAIQTHTEPNAGVTTFVLNTDAACKNSFPSEIEEPVSGLDIFATWDCGGGVIASLTDENGRATSYTYDDTAHDTWRLTSLSHPDGGGVGYVYPGPQFVETITALDGSTNRVNWAMLDPLGRPAFQQTANGTNCDTTQSLYDANGRVSSASEPYAATCTTGSSLPSGGSLYTTRAFDAANRITSTTAPDGSVTGYSYASNTTEVTDAAGKSRISATDGLGRLAAVCEVTSAGSGGCLGTTGFLTAYTYNPNGKMTGVSQNATQSRTFAFDWLGRMTSEANPESGTTDYTFDTASNAACGSPTTSASTGDLILTQNAAGDYTCLQYDALHRVTRKGYSTGEAYTYTFDGSATYNLKGRLASATGSATAVGFEYDTMGRPTQVTEDPGSLTTQTTSYTYNYAGEALTTVLPSARQLDASYDLKARLSSVQDHGTSLYYLEGRSFNAADQVTGQNIGYNGSAALLTLAVAYNNMLQPWHLTYTPTSGSGAELKYNWGGTVDGSGNVTSDDNNGTLRVLTDVGDADRTMTYGYDDLNRISSAVSGDSAITASFTIDPYGNRTSTSASYGTLPESFPASSSTNQITTVTTDAAGRITGGTWGGRWVRRAALAGIQPAKC